MKEAKKLITKCYHCGESCEVSIVFDQKQFCCNGCKTVYEILEQNKLCDYYALNSNPGSQLKNKDSVKRFAYLDDEQVKSKLLRFNDGVVSSVILLIPNIHCSSCVYLLENLFKLHPGIMRSTVNFTNRTIHISFNPHEITLRQLVELLASIGYEPQINLNDLEEKQTENHLRKYYIKIGIAFFAFGNIMLLTFPEYLGINLTPDSPLRPFFNYLNFLLSLPLVFYCAGEFFTSAWNAVKSKNLNMDTPIALGIIAMFLRSSFEAFSHTGSGYFDTLTGLILLMLIGRFFQNKTYASLSFERDYKSYFPVAVNVVKNGSEISTPLSNLKSGNRIVVRNQELIPADAVLTGNSGSIDYSFVTGEATPVYKKDGELVYAGGRNAGNAIELETVKEVSQSYLTRLWNDAAFEKSAGANVSTLATRLSRWFTPLVISIALVAGLYWWNNDFHKALNAFTAVLIITCPCALALSSPFTLGSILRILNRNKIYLKNNTVVERLSKVDAIIFDKTGTITDRRSASVVFEGGELSSYEQNLVKSLTHHSTHPLSQKIFNSFPSTPIISSSHFKETQGKGIEGWIDENHVKLGSKAYFLDNADNTPADNANFRNSSKIYLEINGKMRGHFAVKSEYRPGLAALLLALKAKAEIYLLSGDNDAEKEFLKQYIAEENLVFYQQPMDKLQFVKQLQQEGKEVMMIGDGLNDAGALKQANVGLVVSDNINNFSPACDGIIEASNFPKLDRLITYAKRGVNIIKISFAISFCYNIIGLSFAVHGTLSPLVAAILMPVSSITIITFTTLASYLAAPKAFNLRTD